MSQSTAMREVAKSVTAPKAQHDELIRVLQSSLYPGAKAASIELVLSYCRVNGLDPMLKPVHIVPQSVKRPDGSWQTIDVLMPGIADYRIKASRSGEYAGLSEPEFGPDITETLDGVKVTFPQWCKVTVRRIVQGQICDFPAKEYWLENYAPAKRDSQAPNTMWRKRAYGQLAKVAEAQALRKAFPEFSGGNATAEEMEGKTGVYDGPTIEATVEPPAPAKPSNDEWITRLTAALDKATIDTEVMSIAEKARAKAPPELSAEIERLVGDAMDRVTGVNTGDSLLDEPGVAGGTE